MNANELALEYQRTKDEKVFEELIGQCYKICNKVTHTFNNIDLEDKEQILRIAVYKAVNYWDKDKGSFSSLLYMVYTNELRLELRKCNKKSAIPNPLSLDEGFIMTNGEVGEYHDFLSSDYDLEEEVIESMEEGTGVLTTLVFSDILNSAQRLAVRELEILLGTMVGREFEEKYNLRPKYCCMILRDIKRRVISAIEQMESINVTPEQYIRLLEENSPTVKKTLRNSYHKNKKEREGNEKVSSM